MTDEPARSYEIEPAPDAVARAAIVAALEHVSREMVDDAHSEWARAGRQEVVDDGLG
jgi:hypothetical protein